jgi:hypothetical protein
MNNKTSPKVPQRIDDKSFPCVAPTELWSIWGELYHTAVPTELACIND